MVRTQQQGQSKTLFSSALFSQKKGQAAVEYMVVVGIAFLLATPIIIQGYLSAGELQQSTNQILAKNALDSIEEAATFVWSQGEPARLTFDITLPESVINATPNGTTTEYIRFTLQRGEYTQDLTNVLKFEINGTLPTARGRHTLRITAEDSRVTIEEVS